jgi:hypothetical protein
MSTVARLRSILATMINVISGQYLVDFVVITVGSVLANMINVISGQYLVDFVVSTVAARGNDAARVKGRRVMMIPR